ncbi:15903_t:CDS:1, partial [Rhizophagus irregularis]
VPWLANTLSMSVPSIALLLGDAHILKLLAGWEVLSDFLFLKENIFFEITGDRQ